MLLQHSGKTFLYTIEIVQNIGIYDWPKIDVFRFAKNIKILLREMGHLVHKNTSSLSLAIILDTEDIYFPYSLPLSSSFSSNLNLSYRIVYSCISMYNKSPFDWISTHWLCHDVAVSVFYANQNRNTISCGCELRRRVLAKIQFH